MTGGTTIGVKPSLPYNEDVLKLALGDAIFLYTGGATTRWVLKITATLAATAFGSEQRGCQVDCGGGRNLALQW